MRVPVVTLVGKRHGERTSYSILRNLGVEATIAATGRDFVAIAARLADDAAFRAEVVAAIARGLERSPLVDMRAHARHLEAAYLQALAASAAAQGSGG
jgi:predicted O-linked N-acetylglucosamine transferase (SPINDLY family)